MISDIGRHRRVRTMSDIWKRRGGFTLSDIGRRRRDLTMFTAVHGELLLHSWRDPVDPKSDAYGLFYGRSFAMGWLREATQQARGGIWGMNDAGHDLNFGARLSDRIWFQVGVNKLVKRSLPIQPFLACAGDVVARMGTLLRLDAVEVLLPMHGLISKSTWWLSENDWFLQDYNPHLTTHVQVTLDGGQNSSIRSVAPAIFRRMQLMYPSSDDIFVCDSFSLTDDPVVFNHSFSAEALGDGPPQHRVTFHGTLIEWSLDAVGWLAALFAHVSSHHGVDTPLVFTVSRSEESLLRTD